MPFPASSSSEPALFSFIPLIQFSAAMECSLQELFHDLFPTLPLVAQTRISFMPMAHEPDNFLNCSYTVLRLTSLKKIRSCIIIVATGQ